MISPRLINYPRGQACNKTTVQNVFSWESSQCSEWVIQPNPYPYKMQNSLAYTNALSMFDPYVIIKHNTLELRTMQKISRQPIKVEHEKP